MTTLLRISINDLACLFSFAQSLSLFQALAVRVWLHQPPLVDYQSGDEIIHHIGLKSDTSTVSFIEDLLRLGQPLNNQSIPSDVER